MSESHAAEQPGSRPPMTTQPSAATTLVKELGSKYLTEAAKEAAKEGGKQAVDYEKENGQQQLDDAKATAQNMWAKYCGCFGSA